jgi:hypothetical protein
MYTRLALTSEARVTQRFDYHDTHYPSEGDASPAHSCSRDDVMDLSILECMDNRIPRRLWQLRINEINLVVMFPKPLSKISLARSA